MNFDGNIPGSRRYTRSVVEYCTCGAKTVEGARFCHKCGRPLYDEPIVADEPVVEAPPPPASAQSAPAKETEISFRNRIAVNVGLAVAGLAIVANQLLALFGSLVLQLISLVGLSLLSGLFAVWLYKQRTGQSVSVKSGARLGWITGVFSFVIVTVLTTITIAMMGPDTLAKAYRDPRLAPSMPKAELDAFLSDPAAMATMFIFGMAAAFAMYTIAASIGGALGAKMLDKDSAA